MTSRGRGRRWTANRVAEYLMTIEDHDDSSSDDQEDDGIEIYINIRLNMQINRPMAYNYYKRPRPTKQ